MSKNAKFDREEVIEKATNLYWEKGYHGTSMRNLQVAVDLRPGSIYAAFGSKDNLFKESIHFYARTTGQILQNCLDESSSPISGLKSFIKKIIIDNRDCAPSNMCMIVKSVSELTEIDNKELLEVVTKLLNGIEQKFCSIIQQAIDEGELEQHKDPMELARHLQVQIIGLRTYSHLNNDMQIINKFIDDIFLNAPFR